MFMFEKSGVGFLDNFLTFKKAMGGLVRVNKTEDFHHFITFKPIKNIEDQKGTKYHVPTILSQLINPNSLEISEQ